MAELANLNMSSYTVTELNTNIRDLVNNGYKNKKISVQGEISNFKISGRSTYFTLKDDNASIGVKFFGTVLNNEQGDHVEVIGRVDYHIMYGISLIGTSLKVIGIGSLHKEYELLKNDFEKKGFFNNKKELPHNVKKIGIVTAEGGAALQDLLYVLKKNSFSGEVYLFNCSVQGPNCPSTVSAGIKFFNSPFYLNLSITDTDSRDSCDSRDSKDSTDLKQIDVDLILITRGGGSFEDLMGFSHPKIVEAIFNSKKYVISAVGHEIDNMLSDYVANYRAPTPSVAGEVICSINNMAKNKLNNIYNKLSKDKSLILKKLYNYKELIRKIGSKIKDPSGEFRNKLDDLKSRAHSLIYNKLKIFRNKLNIIKDVINKSDVRNFLDQGFVILTDKNGELLTVIDKIFDNKIKMIHSSGEYEVIIKKTK